MVAPRSVLPALCLALLLTLFSCPSYAGHWHFVVIANGTASAAANGSTKTFPALNTRAEGDTSASADLGGGSNGYGAAAVVPNSGGGPNVRNLAGAAGGGGNTASARVNVSISVTGTWVPNVGQTDPAPPSVKIVEAGSANFSGFNGDGSSSSDEQAADGLGDAGVQSPGSCVSQSSNLHFTDFSGQISFSRTLSASGSTSGSGINNGCSAGAYVTLYTVAIHAQPYNFHRTSGVDNGDGTLSFTYDWLSTDGNKSDLTGCYWHERVEYSGGNPYSAPSPFTQSFPNPSTNPGLGTAGGDMSSTIIGDTHRVVSSSAPYSAVSFTGIQHYEYDDTILGTSNQAIPGNSGAFSIVRSIFYNTPLYGWYYSVSKDGLTARLHL